MPLKLITAPASEPVTLTEAKAHLRVTISDDDTLITSQITMAREWVETYLRRALFTQTWELYLNEFPDCIELAYPPLQSVTWIKYIDTDGVEQTLDAAEYSVHTQNEPALIVEAYGKTWPSIRDELNAVAVQYVTGWDDVADIPSPIKSAILLLIGHLYEHREHAIAGVQVHELPLSIQNLLFPYRVLQF